MAQAPQPADHEGALDVVVRGIDQVNEIVGRAASWMLLAMLLVTLTVVILRYVFSTGFIWLQESYVWLNGAAFMLGAGYVLLKDAHVRVDVFYRGASWRFRACVNLAGSLLLLLPMVAVVFYLSVPYVAASWAQLESSREASGLPGVFALKSILLVFCVLLGLQGLSLAARSLLTLIRRQA